jgi:hypothetical protein
MIVNKREFNWRGWTTFVVTISFVVDTISGIILYIAPPGRIANWTNWTVWGLGKEEWGAIHTIFGYLLLVIVGVHLYHNWKIFMSFIWSKIKKASNLMRELVVATLLCLFVFLGTLWNVPPFSTTIHLGERIKGSWAESKVEVPIAHAELMSLREFAAKIQVPVDQLESSLRSKGYGVRSIEHTLQEIASANNTSPENLYEAMKSGGVKSTIPSAIEGSGLGKKTLETICSEQGFSLEEVLVRLEKKGIKASSKSKVKEIANRHSKTPMEIYEIIAGKQ